MSTWRVGGRGGGEGVGEERETKKSRIMTRKTPWKWDPVPGRAFLPPGRWQCQGLYLGCEEGKRTLKANIVNFLIVAPHLGKQELVMNILIPCL